MYTLSALEPIRKNSKQQKKKNNNPQTDLTEDYFFQTKTREKHVSLDLPREREGLHNDTSYNIKATTTGKVELHGI